MAASVLAEYPTKPPGTIVAYTNGAGQRRPAILWRVTEATYEADLFVLGLNAENNTIVLNVDRGTGPNTWR